MCWLEKLLTSFIGKIIKIFLKQFLHKNLNYLYQVLDVAIDVFLGNLYLITLCPQQECITEQEVYLLHWILSYNEFD